VTPDLAGSLALALWTSGFLFIQSEEERRRLVPGLAV
jgi:hypothetical protein